MTSSNIVRGANHGSLLCRIGNSNDHWMLIGSGTTITAHKDGYLELLINDRDKGNNSGSFSGEVKIIWN